MNTQSAFVVLALDTTGPNTERDAIAGIAARRIGDGAEPMRLGVQVAPSVDAPGDAVPMSGGSSGSATPLASALSELERFAAGCVVVGHGLEAWWPFLRRHGALDDASTCDVAELQAVLRPSTRAGSLDAICVDLGVAGPRDGADAADRVDATVRAFEALQRLALELDPGIAHAVDRLGRLSGWSLAPVFRSAAAAAAESRAPARLLSSVGPPPKPLRPEADDVRLDGRALEALIAPGGTLASSLTTYRDRPGQRRMLRMVCDAFELGDQLLVEAGTGTGKTLAYLIPAAAWSLESGRHVVVATNTIALQDQLVGKDAPAVETLIGGGLRVCVLKGRANYLCRSRLAALAARDDLATDAVPTVARLLVWSSATRTGDRSELELEAAESRVWQLVSAEGDACTPETCAHAAAGTCWLHRARAQAEASHIVVVSHALLISDMMVDNRVLPHHDHLVIDEAHHLEEVATTALGFTGSRRGLRALMSSIERPDERGLLPEIAASIAKAQLLQPTVDWQPMLGGTADLRRVAHRSRTACEALFDELDALMNDHGGKNLVELRLTDGVRHGDCWQIVEDSWAGLASAFEDLRSGLVRLGHALTAAEAHLDEGSALASDVAKTLRDLRHVESGLGRAIGNPTANDVIWLARRGDQVSLHTVPLHVGEPLSARLFSDKEALVLTSATLRAGPGFEYVRERLDLPDAPGEVVDSPFDFDDAVLVAVPEDIPEPGHADYQAAIDQCISQMAVSLGGRLMVLYTSHSGLRQSYHGIRGPLGAAGIAVIGQGMDGSRRRLLERFAAPQRPTVLLGTRSFWEGVDVPGDALTGLIMARLPFDVPTDPVFAARSETFEEPFAEYALPRAVLRFRQGFGRLIRRETDRGVFVVLDSRLRRRSYGQRFLDGLPGGRRWTGPTSALAAAARRHVDGRPVELEDTGLGPHDGEDHDAHEAHGGIRT